MEATGAQLALQRASEGVRFHYDLPPEFFRCFLDSGMNYSCAYFAEGDKDLDAAQKAKTDLICRKLDLVPEDHLLDIGCGWGGLLFHAVEAYGCRAAGITLSPIQADYLNDEARRRGLTERLRAEVAHVLEMPFLEGAFSKIATVGAIEHMEELAAVFSECSRVLADEGRMLVHGMVRPKNARADRRPSGAEKWVEEHIFPVGFLRDFSHVSERLERNGFEIVDAHNITDHYTRTLECWLDRLQANEGRAAQIAGHEQTRTFLVWLAGCVCSFEENNLLCYQILTRKIRPGIPRSPLPPRPLEWR